MGQFYAVISWVVLFHNVEMNYQVYDFLWKCVDASYLVDIQDI